MSISGAHPSSSDNTPSTDNSSPYSKSQWSIQCLVAYIKAKCGVSKPKPLENNNDNGVSSSATPNNNDNHSGDLAVFNLIHQDLNFTKAAFEKASKYMDEVKLSIDQACEEFEKLRTRDGSGTELDRLRKTVTKLKAQIPFQFKSRFVDSHQHHNPWPNVNQASDEIMHNLYKDPKFDRAIESEGLSRTFYGMPKYKQLCLLCFFRFPTMAVIKKRVMIYMWIGEVSIPPMDNTLEVDFELDDDKGNEIFNELIVKGFIEPVYQKGSLVPDSCKMSPFVRSALTAKAERLGFPSFYTLGQGPQDIGHDWFGGTCMFNVDQPIIYGGPELFDEAKNIEVLYLGRWQSSVTHHIEVADTKILYGLKNMCKLIFLSLRGISLITELPSLISELTSLKILDLKACHNLEVIPDSIRSLTCLTHLDMSECYFLEHMPRSLASITSLEVLKGFFIGDSKDNKRSCTLNDLSTLGRLRKLTIYTSVKNFPTERHLNALKQFRALRKLTISWGRYSFLGEDKANQWKEGPNIQSSKLPSMLQKLDLQCVPWTISPSWLRPADLKELKKLYIRGGRDLRKFQTGNDEDRWTIQILRLAYLDELEMDWSDLMVSFPDLVYLHKEQCPKFTDFPRDGEWMKR